MNDAIRRLLTVRDRARHTRDEAQRAFQNAERQCAQARSQGQMLLGYRTETATRWTRPTDRSTDPVRMDTAHQFLARLDNVLQQHEHNLHQALEAARRRRNDLLAADSRLAALNKVIERRQLLESTRQQRREQTAFDQLAQRRPSADPASATHPWHAADVTMTQEPADISTPSAPTQEPRPCPHSPCPH